MKLSFIIIVAFLIPLNTIITERGVVYSLSEVDQEPRLENLESVIYENLKWPSSDFSGSGSVKIRTIVNIDGSLSNIKVEKPLCSLCNKEAIRVVNLLPKFSPAIKSNRSVRCWVEIEVKFISPY